MPITTVYPKSSFKYFFHWFTSNQNSASITQYHRISTRVSCGSGFTFGSNIRGYEERSSRPSRDTPEERRRQTGCTERGRDAEGQRDSKGTRETWIRKRDRRRERAYSTRFVSRFSSYPFSRKDIAFCGRNIMEYSLGQMILEITSAARFNPQADFRS